MKKVTLLALVALMVISFAATVFAAAPVQGPAQTPGNWYCPYYGQYYNDLNDDQKAQVNAWRQQMLDQRKQMLVQQVERGYMTQAQADQKLSWMEQQMANGAYGHKGMGGGMMGMQGGKGMMGMRGGMGCW